MHPERSRESVGARCFWGSRLLLVETQQSRRRRNSVSTTIDTSVQTELMLMSPLFKSEQYLQSYAGENLEATASCFGRRPSSLLKLCPYTEQASLPMLILDVEEPSRAPAMASCRKCRSPVSSFGHPNGRRDASERLTMTNLSNRRVENPP